MEGQLQRRFILPLAYPSSWDGFCLDLGAHAMIDHAKPMKEQIEKLKLPPVALIASLTNTDQHYKALCEGRRSFYTAPIKALVSEKFFALCRTFGAHNVGMLTGDASVNPTAPLICCTAEVLANIALRDGAAADVGQVVMDEFHFYADPDRGWAWQVPLLELPRAQFVLMSATLGDVTRFETDLTWRTGRPTAVIHSARDIGPMPARSSGHNVSSVASSLSATACDAARRVSRCSPP